MADDFADGWIRSSWKSMTEEDSVPDGRKLVQKFLHGIGVL